MTIDDILASLEKRGFYTGINYNTAGVQVWAVIEELGEMARMLRRDAQRVMEAPAEVLAIEAADVVIAAVCLLGAVAGDMSGDVIRAKLEADEKRGFLHNDGGK